MIHTSHCEVESWAQPGPGVSQMTTTQQHTPQSIGAQPPPPPYQSLV